MIKDFLNKIKAGLSKEITDPPAVVIEKRVTAVSSEVKLTPNYSKSTTYQQEKVK